VPDVALDAVVLTSAHAPFLCLERVVWFFNHRLTYCHSYNFSILKLKETKKSQAKMLLGNVSLADIVACISFS
jgi:hypothetical protein